MTKSDKIFTKLFFILFFVSISTTTCYAIWKTQGKTILSLVLVMLIGYLTMQLITVRKQNFLTVIKNWKNLKVKQYFIIESNFYRNILSSICILCLCVAANACMLFRFDTNFFGNFAYYVPPQDLVGYANYVNMLNITAQENYNGFSANYFDSYFHGVSPYHFYEFWLAACITQLTGLQAIISYAVIVQSLFYFMTWCGLMAILEFSNHNYTNKSLKIFSLLFIGAIYFPFYKFIPYLESVFYLHNNTILTYGLVEPFLLAAFLFYKQQKHLFAWFIILLIPLISITTYVGIIGFMLFLLIKLPKHTYCFITSFLLLTFSIIIFYFLFGTTNEAAFSWHELLPIFAFNMATQNIDNQVVILFVAKNLVVVFGLYLLKSIIAYSPLMLLLIGFLKNKLTHIIAYSLKFKIAIISLILLPLAAMFLLILHHDASQVFRNFLFPLLNVTAMVMLIPLIFSDDKTKIRIKTQIKIFYFLFIGYQIIFSIYFKIKQVTERQIYSYQYLNKISAIKSFELQGKFGGFIYGQDFYADDLFSKVIRHQLPAGYLAMLPQFYTVVNLEVFNIPKSNKPTHKIFDNHFIQNSEFYQFVTQQKRVNLFKSITQSQADFIVEKQLGFLIISKNISLAPEIQQLIKSEIKDSESGERFLIIK